MAVKREEVLWASERAAEWAVLGGHVPGGQQAWLCFWIAILRRPAAFSSFTLVARWLKVKRASPRAPGLITSNLGRSY